MSSYSIASPYQYFSDSDGSPLDGGMLYIGTANLNAEINQIQIFWDKALTIPAAQPIRTISGYPVRNGTPATLYVNADDYSITVKNKNGSLVFSALTATTLFPFSLISGSLPASRSSYKFPNLYSVTRDVNSRLSDRYSIKDFGAVGDGVTDDSASIQLAFDSLGSVASLYFPSGTYLASGISTNKTISIIGDGAGSTIFKNYSAGSTIFSYTQTGMSDKERRNWLLFEGFTIRDEASFTGIGIKTEGVLSVIFRDLYVREFKTNYGIQALEGLWVYLDCVNSDLCELNFVSTLVPHFNNVVCISGGEFRNPTPGRSALYFEGGDVISVRDSTIEGNSGGPGYVSGGKFRNIKMLTIDNTYFEVLSVASQGALVLDGCQAVRISGGQISSNSTTVPSILVIDSDAVQINRASMVAFPIRTTGVCSVTLEGCLHEGPMDISVSTSFTEISPMPYNTRAVIVTNPYYQRRPSIKPRPFRNTYADSSFETAAPGVTIVAGAPVSSLDASQGYYGPKSWRVTGVNGDTIRSASLGTTVADGQSGCMTFMAKADAAGRFTLTSFLAGAAGGHDIYLSTEWRRYFVVTNLRPASTTGAQFLLQMAFQGTNAFNITDIQFVPFTDYGEIPGIVDGFNYLPTHGAAITGAASKEIDASKRYLDRGLNLRKTTIAPVSPEDGDVYYADGVSWNPGAGAGIYWYNGAVYAKL